MSEDLEREVERVNKEIEKLRARLHAHGGDVMAKYLDIINTLGRLQVKQGYLMAKANFPFPEAED